MTPFPTSPRPDEEALGLLEDLLHFFTHDPNPDRKSLGTLYVLFRTHYLSKLYPRCFDSPPLKNFSRGCPAPLQQTILKYVAIWLVRNPELFSGRLVQEILRAEAGKTPLAALMMDELLMASPEDIELIHEILQQAILLPFAYLGYVKVAMAILRSWIFQPRDRRPDFLHREPYRGVPIEVEDNEEEEEGTAENITTKTAARNLGSHIQRYIRMLLCIFNGRPAASRYAEEQSDLYQEVLFFLRGLAMEAFVELGRPVWETILQGLLDVVHSHLTQPNRYALISTPQLAEEFSQLLAETLFGMMVRSKLTQAALWTRMASLLAQATRWPHVISEWTKVIDQVTTILIEVVWETSPALIKETLEIWTRRPRIGSYEPETGMVLIDNSNADLGASSSPSRDSFLSWAELSWTKQNGYFLWRNLLRALGDPNDIERPELHEQAMACLCSMTDRLLVVRAIQPFEPPIRKDSLASSPPPVYEMVPVFLDAIDLNPKLYERSRIRAIRQLSRLFFRRIDQPFPDDWYGRLYLALISGLADKDDPGTVVLMRESRRLFGLFLPGSLVLVPSYVRTMAGMLNGVIRDAELVGSITRIAAAIAILPLVYEPDMPLARIEAPLAIMSTSVGISWVGDTNLTDLKAQAIQILALLDMQETTHRSQEHHGGLLNAITTLLLCELEGHQKQPTSESIIDGLLGLLLGHLTERGEGPVMPLVIDCMLGLVHCYGLGNVRGEEQPMASGICAAFGETREVLVAQRLILAVRSLLTSEAANENNPSDQIAGRLVLCLMEWIMALPSDWLSRKEAIRDQIFGLMEDILRIVGSGWTLTREAAEMTLVHLLHHHNNYAPVYGASLIGSQVPEARWLSEDEQPADRVLYFGFGQSSILAVQQQQPSGEEAQVRVTMRNMAGKFTWDSRLFFEEMADSLGILKTEQPHNDAFVPFVRVEAQVEPFKPALIGTFPPRVFKHLPDPTKVDFERTDVLSELLQYISEQHPECIAEGVRSLVEPLPVPESRFARVQAVERSCVERHRRELEFTKPWRGGDSNISELVEAKHTPVTPRSKMLGDALPYQYCRNLLASLGLLAPMQGEPLAIKLLPKTASLQRDLRALDRCHSREVIKAAVVYIAPGQEDEQSILQNTGGSSRYEQFMRALGWQVSLASHHGYAGGLEAGMTRDGTARYWCSSLTELVWHEAVHLVADPIEDPKLVRKKRHIGNDAVLVVWNEHHRDYRPSLLMGRGDFGNAVLVVTPVPSAQLYRISIWRDERVPPFGPLFDGCLLGRGLLAPMVRATVISANRAVAASARPADPAMAYSHPFGIRAAQIAEMTQRHSADALVGAGGWGLEQFLAQVIFASGPAVVPEEALYVAALESKMALHDSKKESVAHADSQKVQGDSEKVHEDCQIGDIEKVQSDSQIGDSQKVQGDCQIGDSEKVQGDSQIEDSAKVYAQMIPEDSERHGNAEHSRFPEEGQPSSHSSSSSSTLSIADDQSTQLDADDYDNLQGITCSLPTADESSQERIEYESDDPSIPSISVAEEGTENQ